MNNINSTFTKVDTSTCIDFDLLDAAAAAAASPDPAAMSADFTALQRLMYLIRQTGTSETQAKKMAAVLQALEEMAKIQKRLIYARLETQLATIEASDKDSKMNSSIVIPTVNGETDNVSKEVKLTRVNSEKNLLIENELKLIKSLPKLSARKYLIPFVSRVILSVRTLISLDPGYEDDLKVADQVFHKVVDLLEAEWIEYVRRKKVEDVYLPVMVDFLNEEALREANKMPLYDMDKFDDINYEIL
ncbi:hypothetical protein JYU34_014624 [Plutella xylostella]|uniref:Uncharacterized protein n=1 Tax=Plutella xylostella TaxID=51655 RepID=A0ABQ7QA70_PLUXY|nr:hypothetical protein JYU34_014624 [Plutella xylostella]